MIPLPLEPTTFERWAAELRVARPDIDIQPILPDEKHWKIYANFVNQSAVCQSMGTPRPDTFNSWREWVQAFIRSFGNNA